MYPWRVHLWVPYCKVWLHYTSRTTPPNHHHYQWQQWSTAIWPVGKSPLFYFPIFDHYHHLCRMAMHHNDDNIRDFDEKVSPPAQFQWPHPQHSMPCNFDGNHHHTASARPLMVTITTITSMVTTTHLCLDSTSPATTIHLCQHPSSITRHSKMSHCLPSPPSMPPQPPPPPPISPSPCTTACSSTATTISPSGAYMHDDKQQQQCWQPPPPTTTVIRKL